MNKPERHVIFGTHVVLADEAERYWVELEAERDLYKKALVSIKERCNGVRVLTPTFPFATGIGSIVDAALEDTHE